MEPRKSKLPRDVFKFYAQMYYKRKHTTESKRSCAMVEIYNTWHSMSESEKQQFYNQYHEYKIKYNRHLADQLKKGQLFMKRKKKHNKLLPTYFLKAYIMLFKRALQNCNKSVTQTNEEANVGVEGETLEIDEVGKTLPWIDQSVSDLCDDNKTLDTENEIDIDEQVAELNHSAIGATSTEKDIQSHTEHIFEPAPPTVKKGKDLYCMFDEDKCTPWALLPQKDRKQYIRAVYLIKKEFIINYKKYLESLTDKELFDYYNKKIF